MALASITPARSDTLTVRLTGPVDLTGKRVRLTNSSRETVDYFIAQSPAPLRLYRTGFRQAYGR